MTRRTLAFLDKEVVDIARLVGMARRTSPKDPSHPVPCGIVDLCTKLRTGCCPPKIRLHSYVADGLSGTHSKATI